MKSVSYIKRSRNRTKIILMLSENFKMPSEIAREMDLKISQISGILSDLKKEEIVECINEEEKVGRLYRLTNKGKDVYEIIKENEKKLE
ncbi:MAG: ArsR family transcriptional regulator [Methanobrevibacter sp.]|nr:ArsR family transcriptional regulator [Methanobrevibacter sp.]